MRFRVMVWPMNPVAPVMAIVCVMVTGPGYSQGYIGKS
jgi:hypothetical protein